MRRLSFVELTVRRSLAGQMRSMKDKRLACSARAQRTKGPGKYLATTFLQSKPGQMWRRLSGSSLKLERVRKRKAPRILSGRKGDESAAYLSSLSVWRQLF